MNLCLDPKQRSRARSASLCWSALALCALAPAVVSAAPSARITASRTSGPAPLAVFFDATGTTDSNSSVNAFRDLGYRFTFGDASSGTWTHSNRSKNEQIGGPLAAHVFEQPGTYVVSVTAKDASGATSTSSVTVTVQSADSFYPDSRTVCISRTSDFTGCPSNAQRIANASSWPSFQSNHRYLLRAGQDFSSLGTVPFRNGGVGIVDAQLSSFGSGAKPLTAQVFIDSGNTGDTTWSRRVVVANLNANGILQNRGGFDLLLFRNDVVRGGMVDIASTFDYALTNSPATSWRNPENIFLVENRIDRNFASGGNPSAVTGNAVRFAIVGNEIDRTEQHNVRLWQVAKGFIAHNRITGRTMGTIRHALKIHSSGLDPVATTLQPGVAHRQRTSEVLIVDNQLGSDVSNVNWLASSAAQNNESAEGLEKVIWEDNNFRYGTSYARDITWAGRQMVERGNRNITANRAASYGVAGQLALPADWNGPYYGGQQSMKSRFAGTTTTVPNRPTALTVE